MLSVLMSEVDSVVRRASVCRGVGSECCGFEGDTVGWFDENVLGAWGGSAVFPPSNIREVGRDVYPSSGVEVLSAFRYYLQLTKHLALPEKLKGGGVGNALWRRNMTSL